MGNAGRVLMIPKGEYNSATTYGMLDFVYYQGRSYVCKQTSTGNVPTNTTYWQALTGDASAEIQALTNQLTSDTPTTVDYASVIGLTDALGVNVKDVKLKVTPVQAGSGTPSPDNVRPITGWTGAKPTVAGDNLFNGTYDEFVYCPIPKNTEFTASIDASASGVYFGVYDKYKNNIDYWILSSTTPDGNRKYRVITLAKDVYYVKFYSAQGSNYAVKLGDDKVFSPYATTYTINFGDTYYGGTLDVTSGVLTVTDANIASYNGESLPSTWMSDRDVYTAGGTPTMGAQVVYKLATPITVQLTPTQIQLLQGNNTISADCGDVSIQYFKELNIGGAVVELQGAVNDLAQDKIDLASLQTVVAASSDFADFQTRIVSL